MTSNTENSSDDVLPLSSDQKEKLLALHLAEYEMLNARATNTVNVCLLMFAALFGWLAIISTFFIYESAAALTLFGATKLTLLKWGTFLTVQIFALFILLPLKEQYIDLTYIQGILKSRVAELAGTWDFWDYENYVADVKEKKVRQQIEFWIAVVLALALVAASIRSLCSAPTRWSVLGITVNLIMMIYLGWQTVSIIQLRLDISKADKKKDLLGGPGTIAKSPEQNAPSAE